MDAAGKEKMALAYFLFWQAVQEFFDYDIPKNKTVPRAHMTTALPAFKNKPAYALLKKDF